MQKNYGKVAVFLGGNSAERDISLISGQAVLTALLRQNVDAVAIDPQQDLLKQIKQHQPDRVFLALHGRGGEDGLIQGFVETLNLPYTGSGVMGSAIGIDKWRCKQIWSSINLATPIAAKITADSDVDKILSAVGLPMILKPAHEGSSVGMSRVDKAEDFLPALAVARQYDDEIIAERFIIGGEYTVALLNNQALPVIQIKNNATFYDYHAKYEANDTQYLCPCGLSATVEQQLQGIAQQAFTAVGASGWGRADFMLDADNKPWLLEINTTPGMTDHSLVPMAAKAQGLDFDALVLAILDNTL